MLDSVILIKPMIWSSFWWFEAIFSFFWTVDQMWHIPNDRVKWIPFNSGYYSTFQKWDVSQWTSSKKQKQQKLQNRMKSHKHKSKKCVEKWKHAQEVFSWRRRNSILAAEVIVHLKIDESFHFIFILLCWLLVRWLHEHLCFLINFLVPFFLTYTSRWTVYGREKKEVDFHSFRTKKKHTLGSIHAVPWNCTS